MNKVFIVSALRTPIGSFAGKLSKISAVILGSKAIKACINDINLDVNLIDEVFMGNVLSANLGQAPARQASLLAGISNSTPCTTINKVCASGMKAVMIGAQSIMLGHNDVVVAGGMENMSSVPYYSNSLRFGKRLGDTKMIDGLVKDGLTVIFISHKLEEIINLSDYVTIMRNGKVVSTISTQNEDPETLGYKMLGYKVSKAKQVRDINFSKDIFNIKNLSTQSKDPFTINLNTIDLNLKKGQIFGIAGVAGNGQKELMEILLNENDYEFSGDIIFKDLNINNLSTFQRKSLSISYVTEERLGHSAVPEMSLSENIFLSMNHKSEFKKGDFINFEKINSYASDVIKNFNVDTPSYNVKAGKLSGGNLQKFIIGREIMSNPELLILSQPTWGIDAGSEAFIKKTIVELSQKGVSIIIISHDLDELLEVCHQISVLYEGSLSNPLNVEDINITKLGKYMGGLFD